MTKKDKPIGGRNFFNKARPYVYLSPALISIFILGFLPIIYTIYIAFTNYNLNHLDDFQLIGFANFISIFTGPFKAIFFRFSDGQSYLRLWGLSDLFLLAYFSLYY